MEIVTSFFCVVKNKTKANYIIVEQIVESGKAQVVWLWTKVKYDIITRQNQIWYNLKKLDLPCYLKASSLTLGKSMTC